MNMDNVQVFTKNITIIVQLQDANFDYLDSVGDFDVTIEAGPENRTKVIYVDAQHQRQQGAKQNGLIKIFYYGLHTFALDDLKVTCKYPVIVKLDNFSIAKYIDSVAEEKKKVK